MHSRVMGAVTQVFHLSAGLVLWYMIVPCAVEMFLVPAPYKFSETPMHAYLICYKGFLGIAFGIFEFAVVEGWRRQTLVANWKQNGHYGPINGTYSLIHRLSAGLCLAGICALFFFSSQRVVSRLWIPLTGDRRTS